MRAREPRTIETSGLMIYPPSWGRARHLFDLDGAFVRRRRPPGPSPRRSR